MDRPPGLRRFFLADPEAEAPRLTAEDERHATLVLRLERGAELCGLDGRGGLHPLVVERALRGELELRRSGPARREPKPGAPESPLAWIEVAAPLPKGARAAELLGALTQLGLCAFRPLRCARNQGFARESAEERREALERACREACKQSGCAWLPELHPTARPAELRELLSARRTALLAPGARTTLLAWAGGERGAGTAVIAGPEGGFDAEELAALDFAAPVALGPHVLRIETAVLAAVSTLVQVDYARAPRS